MTWHYPEKKNDDEDEPFVIEGPAATALYYAAVWLFVTGLWKTLEVLAFFGGLIKWP
jgi:hypothetical protein